MDNLTHSLVGLMMARAGIDRKVARAAPLMILAANMPDIDVISGLGGGLSYLTWHRSYTHSFAFLPSVALLPLAIMALFRQKVSWWAYFFSLLGVLSHLLLDWTNVYGIRLLLPFSSRWLRLDQTDVLDPWIWALLLLAMAAPALARLVSAEIGAKSRGANRGWAWFALSVLFVYEGARFTAHERALALMNARLFNGSIPRRVTALPSRGSPWLWRGVVEGAGFAALVPIDLAEPFDPGAARIEYDPEANLAIEAARATRAFQVFGGFAQLPFWKITPQVDGNMVELIDLRFGTPLQPGFEARAMVNASGQVTEARFTFGGR